MTCRSRRPTPTMRLGADPWNVDFADPFADPAAANLFSAEIENVNAIGLGRRRRQHLG